MKNISIISRWVYNSVSYLLKEISLVMRQLKVPRFCRDEDDKQWSYCVMFLTAKRVYPKYRLLKFFSLDMQEL